MSGIGHVRNLADVELLQYRKDLIGPGGGLFLGRVGAGVHLHFQSGARDWFGQDCRRRAA
jgi:hypothetical protein